MERSSGKCAYQNVEKLLLILLLEVNPMCPLLYSWHTLNREEIVIHSRLALIFIMMIAYMNGISKLKRLLYTEVKKKDGMRNCKVVDPL